MSYGISFTGANALDSLISLATIGVFGAILALTIASGLGAQLLAMIGDLFVGGRDP